MSPARLRLRTSTTNGLAASAVVHLAVLAALTVTWESTARPERFSGARYTVSFETASPVPAADVRIVDAPEPQQLRPRELHEHRTHEIPQAPAAPEPVSIAQTTVEPLQTIARREEPAELHEPDAKPPPLVRHPLPYPPMTSVAAVLPQSAGTDAETPPDLSANSPPVYPEVAYRNRWQGTVLLRITVDEQGQVSRVAIAQSSGHQVLDEAAASAVRTWRGTPARTQGRPVATQSLLPVRFELQ